MRSLRGKRAVVTGAGRGIGLEIALRLAEEGCAVAVTDVDADVLDDAREAVELAGGRAIGVRMDVTDPDSIAAARERIHGELGPVQVIVNNAGVVHGGEFLEVPLERHLWTYRVNVDGVVATTHSFLPDLVGSSEGHVVNIASASGLVGLPYGSTYASSKWAVIGFSESIRLEMRELGHDHVSVTTVCPSYVSTGMFDGVRSPRATAMLDPEVLADKAVRAILDGRTFVREPWLVKVTPALTSLLPTRASDAVAGLFGVHDGMKGWRGRGGAD